MRRHVYCAIFKIFYLELSMNLMRESRRGEGFLSLSMDGLIKHYLKLYILVFAFIIRYQFPVSNITLANSADIQNNLQPNRTEHYKLKGSVLFIFQTNNQTYLIIIMSQRRSEVIPRGRRSFKYGEEPRGETPGRYDDRLNMSRPVNIRPLMRIEKFNPKEYLVAQCSEHDIEIYKQIFDFINLNEDGMITPLDIRKVLSQYGGYQASRKFVYQAIAEFDRDGSGEISFRQFVEMMTQKPCMKDTVDDISRVFDQIDGDQKGYISVQDLKELAEELHEEITEQQIQEVIKKCDPNGEGVITKEAFIAFNKMTTKKTF